MNLQNRFLQFFFLTTAFFMQYNPQKNPSFKKTEKETAGKNRK